MNIIMINDKEFFEVIKKKNDLNEKNVSGFLELKQTNILSKKLNKLIYYFSPNKVPVYSLEELIDKKIEYDLIVLSSSNYEEVKNKLIARGIPKKKICYNLSKTKYHIIKSIEGLRKLANENITIISYNCWDGVCYQLLDIPYNSPFTWTFIEPKYYCKLISNLKYYLDQDIKMYKHNNLIIGKLADIEIRFLHEKNCEEAKRKFEQRKSRVNYNNLYFHLYTEDIKYAEQFINAPIKNKILFTTDDIKYKYKTNNNVIGFSNWNEYKEVKQFDIKESWEFYLWYAMEYVDIEKWFKQGKL